MSDYDPLDPNAADLEEPWRIGREDYLRQTWDRLIRDHGFRLILADLLAATGYDQPTFVAGQADQSAYLEGRRSIGLALRNTILLQYPEFMMDIERHAQQRAFDGRPSSTSSTRSPG